MAAAIREHLDRPGAGDELVDDAQLSADPAFVTASLRRDPGRRLCDPEGIAAAVANLISPASAMVDAGLRAGQAAPVVGVPAQPVTTKLTAVLQLPPTLRVAAVRAPGTW
ncbi:hypothetical protein GCM10017786_00490 [Amycolatopsis deserti]|uniref:Uncharacterized protein n=1 Tax=Amycolatopsis deserti TaxID=185696 RepID=A0ABQ3IFB7_9PSEU|nr:hypothetical protein [Amycolatopsis deserti]GHE75655.1 hypothetical protein GCM10017786_00490 [Amycolatopsis deserti]